MKKLLPIFLILCLAMSMSVSVFGSSAKDDQAKIDQNEKSIKDTQKQIDQAKADLKKTNADISNLDKQITELNEKISDSQSKLKALSGQISQLQDKQGQYENQRQQQISALDTRLKYMYMNSRTGYIELLFSSKNVVEFINRFTYINKIAIANQQAINDLAKTEKAIQANILEVQDNKSSVQTVNDSLTQQKKQLNTLMAQKQNYISKVNKSISGYQQQINEWKAANDEIKASLQQHIMNGPYYGGKFGWPVPGHYDISSGYGNRISPISGRGEMHDGIDIPCPSGTPIAAAADGVVTFAAYTSNGYGNLVVISHGGGLVSFYGHNSKIACSAGQTVKKGQTIAYAGATGWSTGPHCHFGVHLNDGPVNPMNYLK